MEIAPVCEWLCGKCDMSLCPGAWPGMLGPEKVFIASRDHIPLCAVLARPQPDTNTGQEFGCPTFPHTASDPGAQAGPARHRRPYCLMLPV